MPRGCGACLAPGEKTFDAFDIRLKTGIYYKASLITEAVCSRVLVAGGDVERRWALGAGALGDSRCWRKSRVLKKFFRKTRQDDKSCSIIEGSADRGRRAEFKANSAVR